MAERDELLALAARCEAATEGCIELDEAIGSALRQKPQAWSFNLQAARELVPERWSWSVGETIFYGARTAHAWLGNLHTGADDNITTRAATPALALCAAALRARAAGEEAPHG